MAYSAGWHRTAEGESPSPAFLRIQRQYVAWEIAATLLFYVIIVIWTLR